MALIHDHDYPLGSPLPAGDPHAVSVSLPRWRDVVGYEENDPAVINALRAGYPRFFLSPFIQKLRHAYRAEAAPDESVWAFPSPRVAEEARAYVGAGRVKEAGDGVALLLVPSEKDARAKEFWQHSGLYVSSRQAENILAGRVAAPGTAREELKNCIASFWQVQAADVFLAPTGMGALFSAYRAVTAQGNTKTVQLGFPYIDTLKIQQRFGAGVFLDYAGPQDLAPLAALLQQEKIAAVFCEIPGNPLLRTVDLAALQALLRPHGVPLVIDDTVGAPFDINLHPYADIIVTSLTKFFCSIGNVTGGSAVVNRASPYYAQLREQLFAREELLYPDDAAILLKGGHDFPARMRVMDANAEKLAAFLAAHPAVARVYYPKGDAAYEKLRRAEGGYGALLSFTLKDEKRAPAVYDALAVNKGPSLGTTFTLVCPYTLLAHYTELAWAESCGVSRYLLRVSVGMEAAEDLIARFGKALDAV